MFNFILKIQYLCEDQIPESLPGANKVMEQY